MASLEAERLILSLDYLCFPSKFCGREHGHQGLRIFKFTPACVVMFCALVDLPCTRVGSGASAAAPPVRAKAHGHTPASSPGSPS